MKKHYHISFFIFLAGLNLVYGQENLVPNGSFEEYSECPEWSQLDFANGWKNPTEYSPDYFNACVIIDDGYGVPNNGFGTQSARTGNAYAGIITMIEIDCREYIQTKLKSILLANHTYEVTFYVSPADICTYVSNDIGVYLSATPIHSIEENYTLFLPYIPQIQNNTVVTPLNVRDTWTKVSGTFMANGDERYITIGNFKDDASTDTLHYATLPTPSYWNASYHYIDDVSVVCLDCLTGIYDEELENNINIYPIPASDVLTVDLKDINAENIVVLNSLGVPVFTKSNSDSSQIDVSQYNSGMYFLKIDTKEISVIRKFLINH